MRTIPARFAILPLLAAALCSAYPGTARAAEGAGSDAGAPRSKGKGFQIVSNEEGSVSLHLYTYVRYLSQNNLDSTFTDAFGNTTRLDRRHDIHMNKMNIQFSGWFTDPKLRFVAYAWTSGTSQGQTSQVVVGGNLTYAFDPHLTMGGGIGALPGVRTLEGTYPYWLPLDNRLIADEFFRPSYTMGVWADGNVIERLKYQVMLGNNLSQFGVDASQIDDGLNTLVMALKWYPTTGEFGARSGFGDFDDHQKVATRLGAHFTRSDENSQGQPNTDAFENVQIRLSDGNVIFKPGLFGSGIQIRDATYKMVSADAGVKWHGYSLEGEYYWRWVGNLAGPGVAGLPFAALHDDGFQLQASAMLMPRTVQLYGGVSRVNGGYGDPWDARLGLNWLPWKKHEILWNFEYLYTHRSPVGAASLPYIVGANGPILYASFGIDF